MTGEELGEALSDPARLDALSRSGLMDGPAEASFDRLTRLATRFLDAPTALVSLVDTDRQFFKSCYGLPEPWSRLRQTPLSHSFCKHVVGSGKPLVIEDARTHPLVRDNPAIVDLGVAAYLGIPLIVEDRLVLGAFCAIDTAPRGWTEEHVAILTDLAAAAMTEIALRTEIEVRKRVEEEVIEQRERILVTLASIGDAVIVIDRDGRVTFMNGVAESLSGWTRGESDGKPLSEVFRIVNEHTRAEVENPATKVLREGGIVGLANHTVLIAKDGSETHIDDVATPIRDRSGKVSGVVLVFRDVTEYKKALATLSAAKEAAEAASLAKSAFLATLSHELRTPLAPVLLSVASLAADPGLSDEVRDELKVIRRNVELEARLIDDLLDLTRIAERKLEVNKQPVDAHSLVHHAVNISRDEIALKSLRLRLDLRASRHFVNGDPARLQQVFWNLIKNAVKFTPPEGSITVESDDSDVGLVVRVIDDGIGIDPRSLPHIFEAFEQGGREITRQFGGPGLGLAISKALVEVHGGILTASSQGKDRGATFVVEIPEVLDTPVVFVRPSDVRGRPDPSPTLRILLVEDHKDTARIMLRILKQAGHDVTLAETVAAAREVADRAEFDLLISDVGLPDGSGLEIMRGLRPLPGIALSGFGMQTDVENALEAGFLGHLTKPVDFAQLDGLIRRVAALER